jgi:hypothetical protein
MATIECRRQVNWRGQYNSNGPVPICYQKTVQHLYLFQYNWLMSGESQMSTSYKLICPALLDNKYSSTASKTCNLKKNHSNKQHDTPHFRRVKSNKKLFVLCCFRTKRDCSSVCMMPASHESSFKLPHSLPTLRLGWTLHSQVMEQVLQPRIRTIRVQSSNVCILLTERIHGFCMILRINNDYFHIVHY